ncbi:uncharacterized protein N7503_004501 [Penicillium pulvis]|uniref:uncharacterized protein n=1 Tax=Penicillium pulvis TaxID=1562058 RepID=UPI002548DD33|nr:uncharacterized protein N7503_004501 [Penicillium pulvis]KAJ5802051.1 hypothetical protein N7503_004501 [Penicillium pulvis]
MPILSTIGARPSWTFCMLCLGHAINVAEPPATVLESTCDWTASSKKCEYCISQHKICEPILALMLGDAIALSELQRFARSIQPGSTPLPVAQAGHMANPQLFWPIFAWGPTAQAVAASGSLQLCTAFHSALRVHRAEYEIAGRNKTAKMVGIKMTPPSRLQLILFVSQKELARYRTDSALRLQFSRTSVIDGPVHAWSRQCRLEPSSQGFHTWYAAIHLYFHEISVAVAADLGADSPEVTRVADLWKYYGCEYSLEV